LGSDFISFRHHELEKIHEADVRIDHEIGTLRNINNPRPPQCAQIMKGRTLLYKEFVVFVVVEWRVSFGKN